jgi:1-deoxy-D-xylulose-5-phosphate synthase
MLLSKIQSPKDLRKLSQDQLQGLAEELREYIIKVVSENEGHLGASLGVVELTLLLHYVFNTPKDLLIWDVGHQAYGHKILTGRRDSFKTLRQKNGLSGFPKRDESEYDAFGTGHASTSISAALGMALANQLKGETETHHIAIIGDASVAGGMALEALNHLGTTDANVLVILNDNAIGIDPSVGALKKYFEKVKQESESVQNFFEALNIPFSGPVDGHDLAALKIVLEEQKSIKGPRLLHVITTKGKGLPLAEQDQVKYHAPGKFDPLTGKINKKIASGESKYQDVFGKTLVTLAAKNDKIVAITPAMPSGSSLNLMMTAFPERCFDVGIAEQHAVTLAAGMATQGYVPFCAIYSTFLQRAYDQVIHDVALQNLAVVFCLDRAGLVGNDGPSHHGVFDIAYLRCIPNIIVAAPKDEIDLRNLLYTSQLNLNQPLAIRYPRGYGKIVNWELPFEKVEFGKGKCLKEGSEVGIISLGTIALQVKEAIDLVSEKSRIAHYDLAYVKPLDEKLLHEVFKKYKSILIVEDGAVRGGAGSAVLEFAAINEYKVNTVLMGIPDDFISHGTTPELFRDLGLDAEGIAKKIKTLL